MPGLKRFNIKRRPQKTFTIPRFHATLGFKNAISALRSRQRLTARLQSRRPEIKSLDIPRTITDVAIPANATVVPLNLIQEGSSFYNRIGRKINMKSLHIRGYLAYKNEAINVYIWNDVVRMLIIYDSQTNGALPAVTTVIQQYDQAGAVTNPGLGGLNLNNRDRYRILADHHLYVTDTNMAAATGGKVSSTPGTPDQVTSTMFVNRFIKLKNLVTQYQASSNPSVIGDISTGSLYMILISDDPNNDNLRELIWTARLRYEDV